MIFNIIILKYSHLLCVNILAIQYEWGTCVVLVPKNAKDHSPHRRCLWAAGPKVRKELGHGHLKNGEIWRTLYLGVHPRWKVDSWIVSIRS